jgi:hypothetical protein
MNAGFRATVWSLLVELWKIPAVIGINVRQFSSLPARVIVTEQG